MSAYIGNAPTPQATQTRQTFIATSGQTTFNTVGYTAGFVDVYMNGVRLVDGTDFTATNGSDVVLTTGAAAGDTIEVVSYSTYEVNSQNYTGGLTVNNDGATVLTVDRATSDGTIIDVQKGGTSVGGIGVSASDDFYIGASTASHAGVYFGTDIVYPMRANSLSDGVTSIGHSSNRFNNLYLSGGVYLGGTGAANKLDDYEEGTYTVTLVPQYGTITMNSSQDLAKYVKIGSLVYVSGQVRLSSVSGASGSHVTFSLPFANSSGSELSSHHWSPVVVYAFGYTNRDQGLWLYDSNSSARFLDSNYNYIPPSAFSGDEEIIFSFTYRTDA